jgi:hypothetical protein
LQNYGRYGHLTFMPDDLRGPWSAILWCQCPAFIYSHQRCYLPKQKQEVKRRGSNKMYMRYVIHVASRSGSEKSKCRNSGANEDRRAFRNIDKSKDYVVCPVLIAVSPHMPACWSRLPHQSTVIRQYLAPGSDVSCSPRSNFAVE